MPILLMLRQYNLKWGVIFSAFIALLGAIPFVIRANLGRILEIIAVFFFQIEASWFIHHFFLLHFSRPTSRLSSILKAIASVATGTLASFGIFRLFGIDSFTLFTGTSLDRLPPQRALLLDMFKPAIFSGFTYFVVYYIEVNRLLQQSKLENEYLKQDQLRAQLFSLQAQLSPHFLFNSLSTLKTIAPDQATKTYVMQLAKVYRYLLAFHDAQRVSLDTELDFMRSYLYIIQERFEGALKVSTMVADRYLDHHIPPLALQILVENALKHNVISMEQPLCLRIFTGDDGMLTVENSFQPRLSLEESNGKGLQNIADRYRLLANKEIGICLHNDLFTVTLPLLAP